ncbi:acetate uptake transporter [Methanospirillum sp. J.3.6.1-F.2.7.3]|uniref:Acetate uptake transporter n=1 Tax=Methanospirillum purgamenti TaxID=2834276 RepID=A0A8E7B2P7_9EURY|nr:MULTISPECIES: acetate uptake transporter [Methanospirillum]MDX8549370.1 acetate uptake transporter [Methanospirillum hungatei]QVV89342.1 acetate uptake transporter [Methanospirillum sp. J.3.6.1-F.2.7.3]
MEHIDERSRNNIFLVDDTANPAPLGLCAFGMTTILLSLHNAGITAIGSPILAMALFYGGIAQVIAGILEWKKNNTFGMVTFGSFGFFWISFAFILLLPKMNLIGAPTNPELAAFLGVWGLFALGLFICTFRMHRVLQVTLFFVVLLVALLVLNELTGIAMLGIFGGYVGLIAGLLALYIGMGQVINEVFGERIFPV